MSTMTEYQRRQCMKVIDALFEYRISTMFAQPVDPNRDNCPTYFDLVKYPMDLGTVRQKLLRNEYASVSHWKSDVEKVWENCTLFNGKTALINTLAKQLQTIFRKLTENMTGNDPLDWATVSEELKNEVNRILKLGPKPKPVQTERKLNPPRIKRQSSVQPKEMAPPPVPTPATVPKPQKPKIQTRQAPVDPVKLANDVNDLQNPDHIQEVINLIKEHEPGLIQGEDVELEIGKLQESTLIAIRKLIDQL